MIYSEVSSSEVNTSKAVDSQPINKKHVLITSLPCEVTDIHASRQNPENETYGMDRMADREEMDSQLEDGDSYTSEVQSTIDIGTKWVIDKGSSSEEHLGEIHTLQNHPLQSGISENIVSENIVTKSLLVPQKSCNYENVINERDAYNYLLERMDWNTLFTKSSLNTEIGNCSMNENNDLHGGHSSVTRSKPESLFPDLQITITNLSQSELETEIGKCPTKYPEQRRGKKWFREKMVKKYIRNKNKHKLYNKKKERKCCSTKMLSSLSKGRLTTVAQSEKHIKNILNTLNMEALLCKNKIISKKIDVFHLRKAQGRVRSFKNVTKAERNSNDSLKTCEVLHRESSPSVTPDSFPNTPCSSASVRNMTIIERERVSEKSATLDTVQHEKSGLTSDDEHIMTNEQRNHERYIQENVTSTMRGTKEKFNSEASIYASENIAKCLHSISEQNEVVCQADERKNEGTCKSDVKINTVTFDASVQVTVESSTETNALQPDNVSVILENDVPECEGGNVGASGILEIKGGNSNLKPHINDISLKPFISLKQKDTAHTSHMIPLKESISMQMSSSSTRLYSNSPLSTVSEQDIEVVNANSTLSLSPYDAKPNKTNQHFTFSGARTNENPFPDDYSNNCIDHSSDVKCTQIGIKQKCSDFKINMSEVLQKADETSCLNILHEQIIFCRYFLPFFIKAFEKKQGCSFECVLVSRAILESAGKNTPLSCKLKPSAIESLVELQIIMETIEFIENKKRFLAGEPTYRSLLWFDDSLCSELFGDQSGYQQQSNFYPAFQRRLKYSALSELQSYHKQLVDNFENTRWENSSYYTLLKSKREIKECEAAMESDFDVSDFFLSVPYVCGANYGDTLEDLESIRKYIVNLINLSKSLPWINLNAEKKDHFWVIVEIIATKVEFIKTCEEVNLKTSLFGLEHIFFDATKASQEKTKSTNENLKGFQMSNKMVLSKFYEIYKRVIELIAKKSAEGCYSSENENGQQKVNRFIRDYLVLPQNISCIGEILDEAQSADTERLQQLMSRCTEHMEMLKKFFQILQEEDASVVITKENVLGFMKSGGITPVVLKPEAVEVYILKWQWHMKQFFSLRTQLPKK